MSSDKSHDPRARLEKYLTEAREVDLSEGQRRARYRVYSIIARALKRARRDPSFRKALWGRGHRPNIERQFFSNVRRRFFGDRPKATASEMDSNVTRIWREEMSPDEVMKDFKKYGQAGFSKKIRKVPKTGSAVTASDW